MEAIWKIEVEDFPAFIWSDDKGNDFFQQIVNKQCANCSNLFGPAPGMLLCDPPATSLRLKFHAYWSIVSIFPDLRTHHDRTLKLLILNTGALALTLILIYTGISGP